MKSNKSVKEIYLNIFLLSGTIAVCALLFEFSSYIYIKCCSESVKPSASDFVSNLESSWLRQYYKTTYDPQLGWQYKSNFSKSGENSAGELWRWSTDEFGARLNPNFGASLTPYIATFGDSWTFGDEVDDDETWQHFLSNKLGTNVSNYGVNAYGTGQALLRFKDKLNAGLSPKIVILGIFEDNFKRVLNRFRPFYFAKTGLKLGFKPRAYLDDLGRLRFLETELKATVYDRKKLLYLVEASREGDFWANFYPRSEFPFSLNLARATFMRICIAYPSMPNCSSAKEPTWNTSEVQELMNAVILEFIRISKKEKIIPIILFFSARTYPNYNLYISNLRKQIVVDDALIIDFSESPAFDPSKIRITKTAGHLSAHGNELVAEYLAQRLSETLLRNSTIDERHRF